MNGEFPRFLGKREVMRSGKSRLSSTTAIAFSSAVEESCDYALL